MRALHSRLAPGVFREQLKSLIMNNMAKQLIMDRLYMDIAFSISKLSTSTRRKVGAIIVKDNNIIAMGFNGTPSGFPNECEDSLGRTKPEVLHAESNAITKCCRNGISSVGSDLYTTACPCIECAKLIIQSGIKRVVYLDAYRNNHGLDLLNKANIPTIQI